MPVSLEPSYGRRLEVLVGKHEAAGQRTATPVQVRVVFDEQDAGPASCEVSSTMSTVTAKGGRSFGSYDARQAASP